VLYIWSWRRLLIHIRGLSDQSVLQSRRVKQKRVVSDKDELKRRWSELFM